MYTNEIKYSEDSVSNVKKSVYVCVCIFCLNYTTVRMAADKN